MKRDKPRLIYDGDCHFCCRWIERWRKSTGDKVEYCPAKEVAAEHPDIPAEAYTRSVQWVDEGGHREEGAAASLHALARGSWLGRVALWLYRYMPLFAVVAEFLYRLVAANRMFFSRVTSWLWGDDKKS